jgi:hypothetical protein
MTAVHALRIHETTPNPWFVLVHAKHGRTARDQAVYNSGFARMLNVNGRWSSHPTREVPVLVWRDRAAADEALAVCGEHRGQGVIVSTFWHSGMEVGREVVLFTRDHAPALEGHVSTQASVEAKAEAARVKALASAGFLVARATGDEQLARRARELSSKAGAGAAEFLTGKAGSAVAASIVNGTLPADAHVTREHVATAMRIAQGVMEERQPPGRFGARRG